MCHRDKKLWIEYSIISMCEIFYIHRVHVMNIDSIVDIVTFDAKIAAIITKDHDVAYIAPFS